MIKAGELDRTIVIQSFPPTRTASGQSKAGVATTFATVPAKFEGLNAYERFSSDAIHSINAGKFTIRYLSGLTEKMEIVHESLNWRILGIREIGRREGIEIIAEAIQ